MTPDSQQPAVYKSIEESLRRKLEEGAWAPGMMLPSRRDLAAQYGVSSLTIERAIAPLVADGLLRADGRRGTFVSDAPAAQTAVAVAQSPLMPAGPAVRPATIGIVASLYVHRSDHLGLNNMWVRQIIEAIERSVADGGHATRFFNQVAGPDDGVQPLAEALGCAASSGVDALAVIAFGMNSPAVDDALGVLQDRELPVVCITSGHLQRPVPHVFLDNFSAGYQAAEHLISQQARELLFLAPFSAVWIDERLHGISVAAQHRFGPSAPVTVFPGGQTPAWIQEEDPEEMGYRCGLALLGRGRPPFGVIGVNDGVTLGFLRAAEERGLRMGHDFVAVSFDDAPASREAGLTSLRPPMEAIGWEASRLLLQGLHGPALGAQVRLRWHLIPRASSQPAAR